MDHAPAVDWGLAQRIAAARIQDLPALTAQELAMLVADLRVTARRAGEIAAEHLEVDSVGAGRISVVDWAGWSRAVQQMADGAFTELGLTQPTPGVGTTMAGLRNGAVLGAGLRAVSRRLLGQYDAFTGSDTLYLVAPTMLTHERKHRFVPAHFRLWVALHEQTHALQFRLAPWLKDHLAARMKLILEDEISFTDGVLAWARTRDAASLFASPEAGRALDEISAAMTFLEGHADYVSDAAGRRHASTIPTMRRAFARSPEAGFLGRLSKSFDKNAQYRDGLEFCLRAQRLKHRRALSAAFLAPENLPTAAEIADPAAWVKRIHG